MGLAVRNGFADLESPLPQAGLDQQKGKFNALAYHDRSICAHVERGFSRGVAVVQDIFNSGKFEILAGLILENESRHFVMLEPLPPTVCPMRCVGSNIDTFGTPTISLFAHDPSANALRLSRGRTGYHPRVI
jgi:hypothetical protein